MHQTGDQKVIRSSTPPLSEFLRARRCQPRSVPTKRHASRPRHRVEAAGGGWSARTSRTTSLTAPPPSASAAPSRCPHPRQS